MQLSKDLLQEVFKEKLKEFEKKYGKNATNDLYNIVALNDQINKTEKSRVIALSEWNLYHPAPSVNAIRHYINDKKEGLENVMTRIGSRIFLKEAEFIEWCKKGVV